MEARMEPMTFEVAPDQLRARAADAPAQQGTPEPRWGTAQKVGFRFAFSYIALYLLPFSATLGWYWCFLGVTWYDHTYEAHWRRLVPWVSAHVLRLDYPITISV